MPQVEVRPAEVDDVPGLAASLAANRDFLAPYGPVPVQDANRQQQARRSQRVLRVNGFEEIGVARDYLLINSEWRDHLLFQRTAPA